MRYDFEFVIAEAGNDYLKDALPADFQKVSPVVTFFDPMALPGTTGDGSQPEMDTENRVIVFGNRGQTNVESPQDCAVELEIELRSRWAQASLAVDISAHRERLNTLCALLFLTNIAGGTNLDGFRDLLMEYVDANVGINKVQPGVHFDTVINDHNWILSRRVFEVRCFAQTVTT